MSETTNEQTDTTTREQSRETAILAAGLLVGFTIKPVGGKHYNRTVIRHDVDDEADREEREYNTVAVLTAKDARREAERRCAQARRDIASVCAKVPGGFLCRESNESKLWPVLDQIMRSVEDFNNDPDYGSKVHIDYDPPVPQRIAPADSGVLSTITAEINRISSAIEDALTGEEAAIVEAAGSAARGGSSVEEILAMEPGQERDSAIAACRAAVMRKAVAKMGGMDQLFTGEASQQVRDLVENVRAVAKDLKRRVCRNKQSLDVALGQVDLAGFATARGTFVQANQAARARVAEMTAERAARYAPADPSPDDNDDGDETPISPRSVQPKAAPDAAETTTPTVPPVARRTVARPPAPADDGESEGSTPPPFAGSQRNVRVARKAGGWRLPVDLDDDEETGS